MTSADEKTFTSAFKMKPIYKEICFEKQQIYI